MTMKHIVACKHCKRLFQTYCGETCPGCLCEEEATLSKMFKVLSRNRFADGLDVDKLATALDLTVEEIEWYYRRGLLGEAANYLNVRCERCETTVSCQERRGRYCLKCSNLRRLMKLTAF